MEEDGLNNRVVIIVFIVITLFFVKDSIINLFRFGTWVKPTLSLVEIQDVRDTDSNYYNDYYEYLNNLTYNNYVEYKELNNFVTFYRGGDNYIYYRVKGKNKGTIIDGLDVRGIKTIVNDVYALFYCDGVAHSDEETLYILTGDGKLYYLASSYDKEFNYNEPILLSYKLIVDVYTKEIDNYKYIYAMDINGREHNLTIDSKIPFKYKNEGY